MDVESSNYLIRNDLCNVCVLARVAHRGPLPIYLIDREQLPQRVADKMNAVSLPDALTVTWLSYPLGADGAASVLN